MNMKTGMFSTRDFYLACFLKARDIRLIRTERRGSILVFFFEDSGKLQQMIARFYSNEEEVPASRFVNAIRDLKALVHNVK
ncbi:MAG: hypothetical protein JW770_06750 [Actinobacteria bacterium]|nr:hypothetical protein [Actinomycetota bacterium]